MKALQKDPAERFQTADALSRELQNIRKGLHPSASKAEHGRDALRQHAGACARCTTT